MSVNRRIVTALRSDVGRIRRNNEDALAEDAELGLLVLADGMGGHKAGEIASHMAVESTLEYLRRRRPPDRAPEPDSALMTSPESHGRTSSALLREALENAHAEIQGAAQSNEDYSGMGTTVVACLLEILRVTIAWVGDSRAYRLHDQKLELLTRDHSLIEEMIASGLYSRPQALRLLQRNVVTRALGAQGPIAVDVIVTTLENDDILLLCSDGLTDMLDDEQLRLALLAHPDSLDETADTLIEQAKAAGGHDNITVALAQVI